MLKTVLKVGYIIVMLLSLMGCTQVEIEETEETEEIVSEEVIIGFSQIATDWPWIVAQTNSVVAEAKLQGYELVWTDAESSMDQQKEDIQSLIDMGVTYLIIVPSEEYGYEALIRQADQKDIMVIILGREARAVTDNVISIQSDQVLEGRMAAEWLVEQLGGEGNVIELSGNEGSSSARYRNQGFYEVIEQYPDITVLASESGEFTRSGGNDAMENILRKYNGEIDGVFSHSDEMAIGAIQALKGVGLAPNEDVIFVSIDGEKDALKAIIAEELGASVKCTPYLGPITFDIIEKLENGEEVDEVYYVETERLYDINNAEEYINKAF